MLLPLGPDEVHDRDEREEDAERDPLVVGDLLGPADQGHTRDGQPDDSNSSAAAAGLSPPIVRSEPLRIELIVPERGSARIPISGDKTGLLDPSNE
jgi:hypothetical protein